MMSQKNRQCADFVIIEEVFSFKDMLSIFGEVILKSTDGILLAWRNK